MKTVLTRNEITRRSITKFFKEILNYKFFCCTCYAYAILSGNYIISFGHKSINIEHNEKIITTIYIYYKNIERIELYIGEYGELYLQIDIDNGVHVIFDENGAGIEFKDEVKEALYNE